VRIAVIPAKGHSRRIPHKNVRTFHGKPILAYSIGTAKSSGLFDRIAVSTEDRFVEIHAGAYGAEIVQRPFKLAEIGAPDCGTQEVTRHALLELGATDGECCCIYPCAPMLWPDDLRRGLNELRKDRYPYVFTQGWFYWGAVQTFLEHPELHNALMIEGPADRWIDIDDESDWQLAEQMYAKWVGQCT